jgi:hypothetical protein
MSNGDDSTTELERLWKLHESGALTRDEFEREKRRVLGDREDSAGDSRAQSQAPERKDPTPASENQAPESTQERSVGLLLGLGIFLIPYIFAWFTLRDGHSTTSRAASFTWLAVFFCAAAAGGSQESNETKTEEPAAAAIQDEASSKAYPSTGDLNVGESATFDDWRVTFGDPSHSRVNGDDRAAPGHVYLTLTYELTNNASQARKDPLEELILKAPNRGSYQTRNVSGPSSFFASVPPSETMTQWQTFEIPEDIPDGPMEFVYPGPNKTRVLRLKVNSHLRPGDPSPEPGSKTERNEPSDQANKPDVHDTAPVPKPRTDSTRSRQSSTAPEKRAADAGNSDARDAGLDTPADAKTDSTEERQPAPVNAEILIDEEPADDEEGFLWKEDGDEAKSTDDNGKADSDMDLF